MKGVSFFIRKLVGARKCLAENGWYYTRHHFFGKIGRRIAKIPVLRPFAFPLLWYAHELYDFKTRDANTGEPLFPEDAAPVDWTAEQFPAKPVRVAVFAFFTPDGVLPETTFMYLKGLGEIADAIICVGDCRIVPDTAERLKKYAMAIQCERHGKYDFGSYCKGYEIAERLGLLHDTAELVIANDSCYGPIEPFENAVRKMSAVGCDFWGISANFWMGQVHIQSFFYFFSAAVVKSGAVGEFLARALSISGRTDAIENFEKKFTAFLVSRGFSWRTLIDFKELRNNPTTFPVRMIKLGSPLVKVKALNGESHESIRKAMSMIARRNAALHGAIAAKIRNERRLFGAAPGP